MKTQHKLWAIGSDGAGCGGGRERSMMKETKREKQSKDNATGGKLLAFRQPQELKLPVPSTHRKPAGPGCMVHGPYGFHSWCPISTVPVPEAVAR